ncbi:MAG: hypothetical protein ACKO40_06335 [Planctomycetaceae bacterium]
MTWRSDGWQAVVACAMVMLCCGCGGPAGPARYRVSGTVTCGGVAVPHGEILFSPDGRQGNTGPQGIAIITGGRYNTQGTRAPGAAGGPTVVRVAALETPGGGLIAEHEFTIDLPKADSEQMIEIPAAGKKTGRPEI